MITTLDDRLQLSVADSLATLVIDRTDKHNALDAAMVRALADVCLQLEHDTALRALVLTGAGNRSFCAGGDIDAWSQLDADDFGRFWIREGHEAFDRLARLRLPVIAVLNGHALGGGFELAACADYRIAEAHVKIGQPEPGLGIIPGWSGTQRVVRRFGANVVRRMALFGEVYDAEAALRLGLIDQLVSTGAGCAAGVALAGQVAARGPRATELTKMLINAAEGEEVGRVVEALAGTLAAETGQLREGLAAYRERRKPAF